MSVRGGCRNFGDCSLIMNVIGTALLFWCYIIMSSVFCGCFVSADSTDALHGSCMVQWCHM